MNALYIHLPNETDLLPSTYNPEWLKTLHIEQLNISHILNATYLYQIADAAYDCVFISEGVLALASRPAFRNWFRIVRLGGRLFLPKHNHTDLLYSGVLYVEPLTESVDFAPHHYVCLTKKAFFLPCIDLLKQTFALQMSQNHAEALSYLQLALLIYPQNTYIYQFLALYYERLNWLEQAKEISYVATLQSPSPQTELLRFMNALSRGDYATGFQLRDEYCHKYLPKQRRCHAYPAPRDEFDAQYWQGENLAGKTFVVWSEFGLGDEIMFAQLAHYLKHVAHVGRLIWVAQPPIVSLLKTHLDIDEVVSAKDAADVVTQFDYWTFPHDLLLHFRQPFAEMPKRLPYLAPQMDKLQHFAHLTQTDKKVKVGLAWRGDPSHENDAYRSIHQVDLLNILLESSPDIQFYCMQKDLNVAERAWLAEKNIPHFSDELGNFADTAALLANMDVVVTVDTSIAHVAGALNLRTCVLLPYVYDWRWGTPLMKNLWYPNTVKFQVQTLNASWHDVLRSVQQTLRQFAQNQ